MQTTYPSATFQAASHRSPGTLFRAAVRLYLGPMVRAQTYRSLLYLLLAFPIGLALFCTWVTVLATGAGTAVVMVGIVLLIVAMYSWRVAAAGEAVLANALLGTRLAAWPTPVPLRPFAWSSLRATAASRQTWSALLFQFLRFPQGVAAFVILTTAFFVPVMLVTIVVADLLQLPTHWFAGEVVSGVGTDARGIYLNGRKLHGPLETIPLGLAGLLLLPLAFGLTGLMGRAAKWMAEAFLPGERTRHWEIGPAPLAAMHDALRWEGANRARARGDTGGIRGQNLALRAHLGAAAVLFIALLTINGLATPGTWWVLWAGWGLGIPAAAHLGFYLRGHLGFHLGLYAAIIFGLFLIDAEYSETRWFFWPALAWLPFLLLHAYISSRLTGNDRASAMRAPPLEPEHGTASPADSAFAHTAPLAAGPGVATMGVSVDPELRKVTVDGEAVDLTPKEFELLTLLYANPGRPFSRDQLLDKIWSNDYEVTDRTIDTHVLRLRKKLGARGSAIQTVWAVGYKYEPVPEDLAGG